MRVGGRTFTVAGIFPAGIANEDTGVISALGDAQALAGRTSDETTTVAVRLAPQTTIPAARRSARSLAHSPA